MIFESFILGLIIGVILIGLIGYYFFVSTVSYLKNETATLIQTSIEKIKMVLKGLERKYQNISLPIDDITYVSKSPENIHPFLLRLVMLCTNWAMNDNIKSYIPSSLRVVDTVGKHAMLYEYRNNLYLVFRGSLYSEDFDNDIDFSQIHPDDYPMDSMVHQGFYKLWSTLESKLIKISNLYHPKKLYIVGYSLGSVLGLLSAKVFQNKNYPVHIYLYAIPRCGNYSFVDYVQTNYKNLSIVNNCTDLIPSLPTPVYSSLLAKNNYYYSDFTIAKRINIQTGDIVKNHTCGTYLKAFEPEAVETEHIPIKWNAPLDSSLFTTMDS